MFSHVNPASDTFTATATIPDVTGGSVAAARSACIQAHPSSLPAIARTCGSFTERVKSLLPLSATVNAGKVTSWARWPNQGV